MTTSSVSARWAFAALAVILGSGTAIAQPTYKVSGISPSPNDPTVWGAEMVEFNGQLFFGDVSGLYRSDGTSGGATLIKGGINPEFLTVMSVSGSPRLFFAAIQAGAGNELWISDGTTAGTVMLKDLRPGASSSDPEELTVVNVGGQDRLFFAANNGTAGSEPWISDGTAAGTNLILDANVGANGSFPSEFVPLNGAVMFAAYAGPNAYWLWRTDGTQAGTTIMLGPTEIHELVAAQNQVFFYSPGGGGLYEPWRSDGTLAGTYQIKDINPTASSLPHDLTVIGNELYFSASDGVNGDELWRSDGSEAGTGMVQEIVPGNNGYGTGPIQTRNVNGRLYFVVDDTIHGKELWTSDGSTATLVKDIYPGTGSSLGFPAADPTEHRPSLLNSDCEAFGRTSIDRCTLMTHVPTLGVDIFFADDGVHGAEPWITDGTPGGTTRLDDIYPGLQRSHQYRSMIRIAGQTVFLVARGPSVPPNDYFSTELWALALTPGITVGPAVVGEGNAGTATAAFTAFVYPASGSQVTVSFATADGTATTASGDYVAASGGLTFAPGTTSQSIPVTVNGDTTPEADETFFVNLSAASGAPILTAQGKGTILNDDGPQISVADITTIESGLAQFFVTLSTTSPNTVTVDYQTANGSATSGADYSATSGTLSFAPGVTFKSVNVTVLSDNLDEPDEDYFLNLFNPTFGVILDGQGQGTIIDDDPTPGLTINNVAVTEPNTGTSALSFTVTLAPASGQPVYVSYASSDVTASGGSDYTPTSGTLTFAPGTLTKVIPVTIIGDVVDEPSETFNMNLSSPVNANITDGLGVGTINDNDTTNITINNVTVAENVPVGFASFTLTLSAPFFQDITIDYATADGTATAPADYTSAAGTLTIPSGATTAAIIVPIVDDNLDEPVAAETFFVNLSNNSGGNLTDAQGQGSITDNDVSQIQITSVALSEGNTGTSPFVFDLTLSGPSVNQVTVNYATAAGSPNPATPNVDYQTTSGTLTFPAGSTTTTPVTVNVIGDTTSEADENFFVNLSGATGGATLPNPAHGLGTILNDDTPGFAINDVTITEGNTGATNATFTVVLQGVFSGTPSVDFATADGTAIQPADYTTSSGTLTFGPGVTTRTLLVSVVGETLDEANENFFVNLSNPTGGVLINDAQGIGTITDNDTTNITIANLTVAENVAGGLANFVVTFSVPNSQAVTLDYVTSDGTAAAPGDYTSMAGTLSFPAGTSSMAVPVPIVDDTLDEPAAAETFFVNLSNSSGPNIGDAQAQGSISDNDVSSLTVDNISVTEGDAGSVDAVFTVSLAGGKTNDVTVNFATAAGTPNPATPDVDYTTSTGTLSFPACSSSPCPAGSLTQSVTVPVLGDVIPEADEKFVVNLSGAVGATIGDSQGVCTIVDNDGLPSLSINDVSINEPSSGTASAVFTVTLAPTSAVSVTVSYATADGTATAPADYTALTGSLSFSPGQSTKTVSVAVKSDAIPEPPETFLVNLTNPVNADFSDDQGLGTIVDATFAPTELVHGSAVQADLAALNPTTPDQDLYRIQQPPHTSWEVVVDAVSGDVPPVSLERVSSTGTVLPPAATPLGDASVSLRWENASASPVSGDRIRVKTGTGGCGTNCDAQDVYHLQAWDTTYRVSRYNNSASQVTVLLIQNPTEATVTGNAWFWSTGTGALNGSTTFTIPAKGVFSLNTASVPGVAGTGGALTVTHNAPYGALMGKAVAVESASGFTFDTALEARPR